MLVVKIGGSIQKDENDFSLISNKVRKYVDGQDKVFVVTSAIKGVTNELIKATENRDMAVDIVGEIYDKHIKLLSRLSDGPVFEETFKEISKLADELFKIAWSIRVLDEITPKVRDYILSFGERMASLLLNAILKSARLDSEAYPDSPLITDSNFGEANVIESLTMNEINKLLKLKSKIVVLPGFIGKTTLHRFTTIGRGGSDYTATMLGKLLNVDKVRLITEVPGIMTADPRRFPGSKTIRRLSLEEAIELAQMGAKRLHPRTFEPMISTDMQVIIEGLYEEGDTTILGSCDGDGGLKGISVIDDVKMISVEGTKIVGKIGSAARVMESAKEAGVNIISISQPISETKISLVINERDVNPLTKKLEELKDVDAIDVEDVAAVSVVGCGLKKWEAFREVEKVAMGYDIFSISRGLGNVSSTFIVPRNEGDKLARSLHEVVLKWTG
ncbi:aspartate kinase [Candidatus Acidianus copahuensis]|uniref:Aspartokinase n=1 Tax=Candidatus Acidianus copahuensis TaxID=1160895 RepID=A0A031LPC5_9CREN|nr:aspartate kinase [Candidatus Acidianus copahuensis]EZQ06831.1 aspartate kinase [Candidatus Acidianus copahuensis]